VGDFGRLQGDLIVRPRGLVLFFILFLLFMTPLFYTILTHLLLVGCWMQGHVTHHGIKTDAASGELVLNRNRFGGHTALESLVKQLSTVQPNWPVALDKPCASAVIVSEPATPATIQTPPPTAVTVLAPSPAESPPVIPTPVRNGDGQGPTTLMLSVRNRTGAIGMYEVDEGLDEYVVGGHQIPACATLEDVLTVLGEAHDEWWPTALAYAVGWPASKEDENALPTNTLINTTFVLIENPFAGFGRAANPAISISTDAKSVSLQCGTPGSHIYYTTDGSIPRADGSGSSVRYAARLFPRARWVRSTSTLIWRCLPSAC
jgi:hypothetical protein